jgi:TFIIF-interacting CTD phosphatase-like protein
MTFTQNIAKCVGLVSAFGAFPSSAATQFAMERDCAQKNDEKKSNQRKERQSLSQSSSAKAVTEDHNQGFVFEQGDEQGEIGSDEASLGGVKNQE